MFNTNQGSLGYQMMKALQGIFRPGASRHNAKRDGREVKLITSINTMRCMSADVHQFARFIRSNWPEVKQLSEIKTEMALAYIDELEERDRSGGHIGRVCASIRKLDTACRAAGVFSLQAQEIINRIAQEDPIIGDLLTLMWKVGLRVTEATYLRAQDIDLVNGMINLNKAGNPNRTKGGRPRSVRYRPEYYEVMTRFKNSSQNHTTGHLFRDRRGLPDRVRMKVRDACRESGIPYLGTHAFRKAFSIEEYHHSRSQGSDDREALLATSHQLGHNRVDVTRQSYIPREERERGKQQPYE